MLACWHLPARLADMYMLRDPALEASPLQMRAVNSWDSTGTLGSPVTSSEVNVVQGGCMRNRCRALLQAGVHAWQVLAAPMEVWCWHA